ncbi:MAG: helix-turn-helix domain-containing protein [Phycisphaerales bacterium]|nr:helix-turn-helix domain-containing protein [Phycisphaerales bacterium]
MKYSFTQPNSEGSLFMLLSAKQFEQNYFQKKKGFTFHTIAWNRGARQTITIDEIQYSFEPNAVLPLMMNQSFCFEDATDIVVWQFNREFYCIVNHDAEVGCVGFLFFGPSRTMFVQLDAEQRDKMEKMLTLFEEEFNSEEEIKSEMLRMLLVRLIILLTRLAKKQYLPIDPNDEKLNLIRQYNLLVEIHFRKERQVQFYASMLNKSPKTVSNLFGMYCKKSPLEIIHDRVIAEAKRLFYYTDKSVKEIANDLGFEDAAHFSKFFKRITTINPSSLKRMTT